MFVQVTNNVSKQTSDVSRMTRQDFILEPRAKPSHLGGPAF